jgi:hypothetical protein
MLLIASFYNYWENEKLHETIYLKAERAQFEGKWATVTKLLETEEQTPENYARILIEEEGPHAFFGNTVSLVEKLYETILHKTQDQVGKVKKTAYKRGYDDKGSLRLPHEHHGIPNYTEKESRRHLLKHPLLR